MNQNLVDLTNQKKISSGKAKDVYEGFTIGTRIIRLNDNASYDGRILAIPGFGIKKCSHIKAVNELLTNNGFATIIIEFLDERTYVTMQVDPLPIEVMVTFDPGRGSMSTKFDNLKNPDYKQYFIEPLIYFAHKHSVVITEDGETKMVPETEAEEYQKYYMDPNIVFIGKGHTPDWGLVPNKEPLNLREDFLMRIPGQLSKYQLREMAKTTRDIAFLLDHAFNLNNELFINGKMEFGLLNGQLCLLEIPTGDEIIWDAIDENQLTCKQRYRVLIDTYKQDVADEFYDGDVSKLTKDDDFRIFARFSQQDFEYILEGYDDLHQRLLEANAA